MSQEKGKKDAMQKFDLQKTLNVLYRVWMAFFAAAKVAIGAAATVLLICLVCGFAFMGVLADYLEGDILPSASLVLESYDMDAPSYVYSVNSEGQIELLQELYASTDWKKADYEELPQALIDAAVAIEDKRFYEHQGVDWFTTVKAFANMFFGDQTVGGSSITQQLIKNRTGEDSVTVQRKVLEFFRATVLEKNYDKKVIIEEYLNSIYFGQGSRGVKSAADAYFGKELQSLTIAECASLISITNNPSMFNPYSENVFSYAGEMMDGAQRNRYRQMLVLGEMLSQGYITQEEYDEAVAQEMVFKSGIADADKWVRCGNADCSYEGIRSTYKTEGSDVICPACGTIVEIASDGSLDVYSYFVDTVLIDVAKAMAEADGITEWNDTIWENYLDQINSGGYHIYTTIDTQVQEQVNKIYQNLENIPKTKSAQQLQSAIVIIDNSTGDIVAMAGGVGDDKVHFGLNRATKSKLQSGSSIKPLTVYAPGFEQGTLTPATVISDLPLSYSDGAWPKNDDRTYSYSRTVFSGIEDSVNAVAANTLQKIGVSYGFEFAKNTFGLSTLDEEEDMQTSSLALGAQHYGITVRDMANAYSTFANKGVYREGRTWTKVYDSDGVLVLDNTQDSEQILSEKTVNYTNYCLTNAVTYGTGAGANFASGFVAGKTGTTSSSRDKWFCGYTKYYTAAVWCGYDTPETISLSFNPASRLWKNVMQPLHKGKTNVSLYDSSKMVEVSVCLDSGKLATEACAKDIRCSRVSTTFVYPEDVPTVYCDKHILLDYCTSGNGVANEYCQHLASAGASVSITNSALVKMTQSELDEISAAAPYGLNSMFLQNKYIYLVDGDGKDASFKGFQNNINQGLSAPYQICTEHTKADWDSYKASHPNAETEDKTDTDNETTTP